MKESSKDRLATFLMDELLERLSARESLRKMLGDMTSLPMDDVIEQLLADFERAVDDYRQKHLSAAKQATEKRQKEKPEPIEADQPSPAVHAEPDVRLPQPPPPSLAPPSEPVEHKSPVVERSIPEPVQQESVKPEPRRSEPARPAPSPRNVPKDPEPERKQLVQIDPIKLEFPKIRLKVSDAPVADKSPEPVHPAKEVQRPAAKKPPDDQENELRRMEEFARKLETERTRSGSHVEPEPPGRVETPHVEPAEALEPDDIFHAGESIEEEIDEDDDEVDTIESVGSPKQTTRARYDFADTEYVYVHAVSRIPSGETAMPGPFMLEEKGIDGHEFAFALDYSGMRFFLSKINPHEMNVSKSMVLLLNKQESIQLQGMHENTMNDLRAHGILLPMEFGTVARGKDSLLSIVDKNIDDLEEALEDLEKTTRWTVTASVLDSTIASIVGTDVQTVGRDRSRDRASYTSSPQGKKFDIKVLERILQREKKLAESVHAELSAAAEKTTVETMIGLGSGSSEDWKVILKASYDVPRRDVVKFNRTVTDLQYHHLQYDLMLAVSGKRDSITLRRK